MSELGDPASRKIDPTSRNRIRHRWPGVTCRLVNVSFTAVVTPPMVVVPTRVPVANRSPAAFVVNRVIVSVPLNTPVTFAALVTTKLVSVVTRGPVAVGPAGANSAYKASKGSNFLRSSHLKAEGELTECRCETAHGCMVIEATKFLTLQFFPGASPQYHDERRS